MDKENKKKAQQERAKAREKAERKKKVSNWLKMWVPIIVVFIVVVIVVAAIVMSCNENSDSGEEEGIIAEDGLDEDDYDDDDYEDEDDDGLLLDTTEGYVVEEGDTVNIDYTGYLDGEAFDGGSTNGAGTDITLGSSGYIDGFDDGVIGHEVGETFDIDVTFPDDYWEESLAGQPVVFTVTINGVYD